MSDLSNLSDNLHQLFNDIKNKNIDLDQAKAMNSTASNIINISKTQISALQAADKLGFMPEGIVPQTVQSITTTKTTVPANPSRETKLEMENFAIKIGYTSRLEAIRDLKLEQFNELFLNDKNTAS